MINSAIFTLCIFQFISLASQIFQFMNKYLLNSDSPYILNYVKTGLAEQQMVILAAIIRDLDRETARTETGQFVVVCDLFKYVFIQISLFVI